LENEKMLMTYLQTVYIIKDKLQRHSLGVQALLKLLDKESSFETLL
jgi:hypothetical protein